MAEGVAQSAHAITKSGEVTLLPTRMRLNDECGQGSQLVIVEAEGRAGTVAPQSGGERAGNGRQAFARSNSSQKRAQRPAFPN
jgi:hypothetical protein